MSFSRSIVPALAAALALAPAGARADLLVTRDGATVETRGAWRVEGRRVVFTLPNGQLSSLRTDDVDLDRSTLATARAAELAAAPPAAAPATLAEPVLRLTERDIPPMSDTGDGEAAPAAAATAAPSVPLEVLSWDRLPLDSGDGVQIFGTLRNTGSGTVIAPALSVSVYGEEGGLLAMTEASINQTSIAAGKTANFRAELPGLPDFAAARFIPSGRGYEGSAPAAGEEGAEGLPDSADAAGSQPELEPVPEPMADVEPPPAP